MQNYLLLDSPVGKLTIVAENEKLTALFMDGQRKHLRSDAVFAPEDPVLQQAVLWLQDYFGGLNPDPNLLPLAPAGTPFRKAVWNLLLQIPYGKTVTYGDLAKQLAHPRMSAQAVGQAVGHNPISIMIPCHRVMGAGNRLTGYDGGISRKIILLKHEGIDTAQMILPKEKQRG